MPALSSVVHAMTLRLDWCSHQAAKYAVEHWHYSGCMPVGKMVSIGVWEDGQYIGCVLFSRGANNNIGRPYHLEQTDVCELTRIALSAHQAPVSRIASIAIGMVRKQSPGVRLLVSYADPNQGHHGGIYQAMGWVYVGRSIGTHQLLINGQLVHKRVAAVRYGTNDSQMLHARYIYPEQKHKYLYPLDTAMRAQIEPLRKPYPKRESSILADAPAVQAGEDRAALIDSLHNSQVTA